MFKMKMDEPLNVMIYNDGRTHVSTPTTPTLTQLTLLRIFDKGVKNGDFNSAKPGRYQFRFTKVSRLSSDATLIAVEE